MPLYALFLLYLTCIAQSLLDPVLGVVPAVAAVAGDIKDKEGIRFLDSECKEVTMVLVDYSAGVRSTVR